MPNIQANVQALLSELGDTSTSESAPDPSAASPATASGSGADSAAADAAALGTPEGGAPDERLTKRQLLEERLADIRERNRARREEREARGLTSKAKADADAAAAERAKFEGLRSGTFLETIRALGKDPATVFAEMKDEAVKAGTPEYKIEQMQQRFDAELKRTLAERVEPLEKALADERAQRAKERAESQAARFDADFDRTVRAEDFRDLVVEYGEQRLHGMVRGFIENPKAFLAHARALRVDLTHADGRFNMTEALTVLKRAQDEHEAQKQQRRGAIAPPSGAAQGTGGKRPTVNGTTQRVASNPLGNDPASSRASGTMQEEPRTTRRQRIAKLIDEDGT